MKGLLPLPPLAGATPALRITIDPEPWRLYRESIARNAPETVALLGGSLDDPLRITDFFFMAPPQQGGRFDHGTAHVALDAMAMNYIIDRALVPNGKYMLGLWHSHPGGYGMPSEPDRRLCAQILRNDDSPGRRWPYFLAPITTFDADGRDRVTAWVMRKGADAFEPAPFAPPAPAPVAFPVPAVPVATAPLVAIPKVPDVPETDPLVSSARQLGALLARPDGPVGIARYRVGVQLHAALRIAEYGAAAELQP